MTSLEDRLERIEKKLDMLLARQQGGAQAASGEMEADIDGPRGDPEVRFMPKRWTGPDRKGQTFSACEPEFLDLLADAYEWFAQRDEETGALDKNGAPKSRWSRLDAARARAWAARLRTREGGEPAAPRRARPMPSATTPAPATPRRSAAPRSANGFDGGDDGDIPF